MYVVVVQWYWYTSQGDAPGSDIARIIGPYDSREKAEKSESRLKISKSQFSFIKKVQEANTVPV